LSLVQARRSGKQGAGAGMASIGKEGITLALLEDSAEVHHGDLVTEVADDSEVVRYEDHRESQTGSQIRPLRGAGLTVEEALLAATWAGAELCGVGDRLGPLAPGYELDAVLLDDDPPTCRRSPAAQA
jgi:predicted amidohydrolase YtcJ